MRVCGQLPGGPFYAACDVCGGQFRMAVTTHKEFMRAMEEAGKEDSLMAVCDKCMELRDRFAERALQGLCAQAHPAISANWGEAERKILAGWAYDMAHAMLVERALPWRKG